MQEQPKPEGKRTQLKIVRENVESLSRDVENFRRSHDSSSKALEARIAALKRQLDSFARSKDLDSFARNHQITSKKLEKQVSVIRAELAALKSHVTKEMARSRAKEEVMLSRILSKVSPKPKAARPSKPKAAKAKPKPKPMKKA
jgi:exonuclease VII large subunit